MTYITALSWQVKLVLILLLGIGLRIWVAQTPMLGTWDERTHALVAKHTMLHPLKPTLYEDPVLPYDYKDWFSAHVWLEKPPLPFWVMAGSMSVFGVNETALRLPSILFSSGSILIAFLIGTLLFGRRVGLYTAFFYAINGKILEVAGGRLSADHVETAFLFFYFAGLYAVMQYWVGQKQSKKQALLIGVLTGTAFLCKWIAAAFIPILWVSIGLLQRRALFSWRGIVHAAWMLLGGLVVAVPWCWYIWQTYPLEAQHTFRRVFLFVSSTVEGHDYPWYNHLSNARIIFGELIYLPMLWLLYEMSRKVKMNSSWILGVLLFVPLIFVSAMSTKRSTYILVAAMGFFVLNSLFIVYLSRVKNKIRLPAWLIRLVLILLVLLPVRYGIERLKPFHSFSEEREITQSVKAIAEYLPPGEKVALFNEPYHLRAMFYHDDLVAYSWIPGDEDLQEIRAKGYTILIRREGKYYVY